MVNRLATRIICVSEGVANVLAAQHVVESRLRVVHNAIDCRMALPPPVTLAERSGRLVIGTVGRLTGLKSVDHLIQAVAQLQQYGIPIYCLVVGEGELRVALEQLAADLGVAKAIRFTGFQAVPLAWVQAMDVCVLCSTKEGLPRVVLEAMLAGKPVVGSDVNGTRELVVHEKTGLLYGYGDVPALTAALRRLATDPCARQAMGEAGRRRVEAGFSIEAYVQGVSDILAEVLE